MAKEISSQIEAIGKEPNTVQLKEFIFGKESSKAQIVMELCDGDLNKCLKGKYGLNKDNKFIIFQLLYSVMDLHKKKIIHRDLKPANLFFQEVMLEGEEA